MRCSICNDTKAMPFTSSNVALCDWHYTAWLREPSCKADSIFAAMKWDGDLTTATPERREEFARELAARTTAWAKAQAEARAA